MSNRCIKRTLGAIVITWFNPAMAEELTIEEIVVTAQKRSQSVLEVPIAVTAHSGGSLVEFGALDVKDILTRTPGLAGASKDSFIDTTSIRGISTNDFGVGGDLSVAIFQNGVHSGRSGEALSGLYDIERVEVLRGPQGLLFGRSATSGAIHVITAKAALDDQISGAVALGGGERGQLRGDFSLNVPIDDKLALRFAGYHSEEDGYVDNLNGGDDLISHENDALRFSLAYAHEQVSLDLIVDYEDREQSPTIYSMLDEAGEPVTGDHLKTATDIRDGGFDETEVANISMTVNYTLPSMDLVSVTGYRSHEFGYGEDFDGSAIQIGNYIVDQEGRYFSQEFRLVSSSPSPWQWFVGVSGFVDDVEADFSIGADEETICLLFVGLACGDFIPEFQANPNGLLESGTAEGESWGASIYGDLSYSFSEQWKVTGGLRYSYDERDFTIASAPMVSDLADAIGRLGLLYGFTTVAPVESSESWTYLNPRVLLEFTPNDAWVFYGSATNGTKPGAFDSFTVADVNPGFPSPIAAPGTDVNSVDEEEVWSYEVGAKGSLLEGRASIALAAYHYAYQDLQQQVFRGVTFATANVGEAEGKGVEMELVLRANEFAQFRASGAWQDVEMKEIDLDVCSTSGGGSCAGNRLPFSPELTANAEVRLTYPFGNSIVYFVSEAIYSDSFFVGLENLPLQETGSWVEWNFRLGADIRENLNLSAFLKNAFNEEHFDGSEDLTEDLGFAIAFGAARPRTFGVDVRYRFGN